jgi:hypothetical protein
MITEKTIQRIWSCQREIRVGGELLSEMERIAKNINNDENAERIKDAFGRERDLQLGIPCGENGHRLLNVSPALAISIINVHIANKKAELVEANEQARIELNTNELS